MVASSSSIDSPMRSRAARVGDGAGGGLQCHAHGEEPLDDVVVQVPGDALAVADEGQLFAVGLGAVELDGEARLLPEALDHPDLLGAEGGPTGQADDAEHAAGPVRRGDGHEEQGPSPAGTASGWSVEHRRRGRRRPWSGPR